MVGAIRSKLDLDTDLFADAFGDDDFFSSSRHKKKGFGFSDDSFFGDDDMGFGHLSNDFKMMDDNFMQDGDDLGANTQSFSSSSSTSYTTATGPDGQVYQEATQQGQQ